MTETNIIRSFENGLNGAFLPNEVELFAYNVAVNDTRYALTLLGKGDPSLSAIKALLDHSINIIGFTPRFPGLKSIITVLLHGVDHLQRYHDNPRSYIVKLTVFEKNYLVELIKPLRANSRLRIYQYPDGRKVLLAINMNPTLNHHNSRAHTVRNRRRQPRIIMPRIILG